MHLTIWRCDDEAFLLDHHSNWSRRCDYIFSDEKPTSAVCDGIRHSRDTAHKAFEWGTKQRASGKGQSFVGSVKEGIGRITGDANLQDEGVGDRMVGEAKDVTGKVGQAVGQAVHDLNV